jgi:hypothetical protein
LLGGGSYAGQQPGAGQGAAAVQADFDVLLRQVEGGGGFGGAEVFNVAEGDYDAVLLGESEDGLFEKLAGFSAGGVFFRAGRRGGEVHGRVSVRVGVIELRIAGAQAETGQGFVDGDASEPGGKQRASGELVEVLVGADVGVLHDVLGLGVVAEDGAGHAVEALVVAAHEDLIESGVSSFDAIDDLVVSEVGSGGLANCSRLHGASPLYRAGTLQKVTELSADWVGRIFQEGVSICGLATLLSGRGNDCI